MMAENNVSGRVSLRKKIVRQRSCENKIGISKHRVTFSSDDVMIIDTIRSDSFKVFKSNPDVIVYVVLFRCIGQRMTNS